MSKFFYIQTEYINRIKDNPEELKALALYLKIKKRYKNGVIYNYKPEKLSEELNITIYESRKYIGKMVSMGLAERQKTETGVNIRTCSFRKLKLEQNGHSSKITVHVKDKISVVVTKLRFSLLRYYLINRQLYIQKTYSDLAKNDKHHAAMEYNKLKKRVKKLQSLGYSLEEPEKESVNVYAGYRKMSNILGVSVGSVRMLLRRLVSWGYINGFKWWIEKSDVDPGMLKYYGVKGRMFVSNGVSYLHKGTLLAL